MQTGKRWHVPVGGGFSPTPKDWPSMGSIVEYIDQRRQGLTRPLPSYVVVPNSLGRLQEAGQYPRPGEHAGWLGRRFNPLTTQIDKRSLTDNPYWRDCSDEELTFQRTGLVEPLERDAVDDAGITHEGDGAIVASEFLIRPCHAHGSGDGRSGVADVEQVVITLSGVGKAAEAAGLSEGIEPVVPPGQELVGIALMTDVPQDTVF